MVIRKKIINEYLKDRLQMLIDSIGVYEKELERNINDLYQRNKELEDRVKCLESNIKSEQKKQ